MLISGVKVVEWGGGISTSYCARILGMLGADVLKIEPAAGDALRLRAPLVETGSGPVGALFLHLNAGKKCVMLDPAVPGQLDVLREALGAADLLVVSEASENLASCRLSLSEIRQAFAHLVVLSLTPGGRNGDHITGTSDMVMQHRAGFAYHQARPVEDPDAQPPIAGADHEASLVVGVAAAGACVTGLLATHVGKEPPHIDMASLDVHAQFCFEAFADWTLGERVFDRKRKDFKGTEVAGGLIWILPCSDGWIMVSPREQHQWSRWIALLGDPVWSKDEGLCGDHLIRKANWSELQERMSEWSRSRPRQEIFQRAQDARVPCFPVSTAADLLQNIQLQDRRFFDTISLDGERSLTVPGLPFRFTTSADVELPRQRHYEVSEPQRPAGKPARSRAVELVP